MSKETPTGAQEGSLSVLCSKTTDMAPGRPGCGRVKGHTDLSLGCDSAKYWKQDCLPPPARVPAAKGVDNIWTQQAHCNGLKLTS